MSKKLTINEFIEKAKQVHGEKYDYSKVEYVNAKTKVCIICPEHGEFWQTPSSHLQGQGCAECGGTKKLTTKGFIEKAKKIHGDKYDYSKVNYATNHTKICIICPEHGEFWQEPSNHLVGKGCIKCSKKYNFSTSEWVSKAKEVHGDKYDYSKVEYTNNRTKLCISCKIHGDFLQEPNNHLQGQGCPLCSESKLEKEINRILVENNILFERQKKFDWLGRQSLDFYLPEYKVAIECQGEQHYKPVDFGGKGNEWAKQELLKTIKRDNKKKILCSDNCIKLLYYSNENKQNILKFIENETF